MKPRFIKIALLCLVLVPVGAVASDFQIDKIVAEGLEKAEAHQTPGRIDSSTLMPSNALAKTTDSDHDSAATPTAPDPATGVSDTPAPVSDNPAKNN